MRRSRQRHVLPGFGLSLGFTVFYLSLMVLIPLSLLFVKSATLSWNDYWAAVSSPRALASYELTLGASLVAAAINGVFGLVVAWTLVRYRFPLYRFIDAIVDLPFALPTAVAGIALTTLYSPNGWIGRLLMPLRVAYTPLGITVALTFIGLPFVVRTLQPVLEEMDTDVEEAAASLGATRWQTLWHVVLPALLPAWMTGFSLALARALGEYGSVVFIAGNMPMKTEIASLLIMTKLEQFDYAGATAIATVLLVASFIILFLINVLQSRVQRQGAA